MYTTYTKWWLSLNGLAHRRQIIFFLGNKYQDTTIFLVRMQQSPSFYTVNIGQFLLQSKKTHWKWEQSWCSKNITGAIKNTACLEHSERLLAIYGCLHREMHINIMLLNIGEKHPLMFFLLNFLPQAGRAPYSCKKEKKVHELIFLKGFIAIGLAGGHVCTTKMESHNMAWVDWDIQPWFIAHIFDIGHP